MFHSDSRTLRQKVSMFAEQMAINRDTLGPNLVSAREANRLTQQDVADRMHVSKKSIGNWERGVTTPEWENLEKIARVLKVDLSDLLDDPEQAGDDAPSYREMFEELLERQATIEMKLDVVLQLFTDAEKLADAIDRRRGSADPQGGSPLRPRLPEVRPPAKGSKTRRSA